MYIKGNPPQAEVLLHEISIQAQIGNEVRKWRRSTGLSQAELANLSSTSQGAIAIIEAGKGNPTVQTLDRILHVLGKRAHIRFLPTLLQPNVSEHPSKSRE
jgi:transcriptional regulator with XRE-family HTH domain